MDCLVEEASDGKAALRKVNFVEPDLILLGTALSEISGFEVCQQLQLEEKSQIIPIIFLSNLEEIKQQIHKLKIGAVNYITR